MKTYTKKNFKYWTAKKLNKHSMTIWLGIAAFIVWFMFYALLFKIGEQMNSGKLISPLTGIKVTQVYANEIPKEKTRWFRLYKFVRWVESNDGTKGLASTCKYKGMVNSIGYRALEGFCFNSQEEEEITFSNWVNKRWNNGMTERALLCQYNTGRATEHCPYVNNDLKNAN